MPTLKSPLAKMPGGKIQNIRSIVAERIKNDKRFAPGRWPLEQLKGISEALYLGVETKLRIGGSTWDPIEPKDAEMTVAFSGGESLSWSPRVLGAIDVVKKGGEEPLVQYYIKINDPWQFLAGLFAGKQRWGPELFPTGIVIPSVKLGGEETSDIIVAVEERLVKGTGLQNLFRRYREGEAGLGSIKGVYSSLASKLNQMLTRVLNIGDSPTPSYLVYTFEDRPDERIRVLEESGHFDIRMLNFGYSVIIPADIEPYTYSREGRLELNNVYGALVSAIRNIEEMTFTLLPSHTAQNAWEGFRNGLLNLARVDPQREMFHRLVFDAAERESGVGFRTMGRVKQRVLEGLAETAIRRIEGELSRADLPNESAREMIDAIGIDVRRFLKNVEEQERIELDIVGSPTSSVITVRGPLPEEIKLVEYVISSKGVDEETKRAVEKGEKCNVGTHFVCAGHVVMRSYGDRWKLTESLKGSPSEIAEIGESIGRALSLMINAEFLPASTDIYERGTYIIPGLEGFLHFKIGITDVANLSKSKDRVRVIADHLTAIAGILSRFDNGVIGWGNLKRELLSNVRDEYHSDVRMAINEVKGGEERRDFFARVGSIERMPETLRERIKSELSTRGCADVSRAFYNVLAMSVTEKAEDQERFFRDIFPNLVDAIKRAREMGVNPDHAFERLRMLGDIFEECRTHPRSGISAGIFSMNKHDFYRAIGNNPNAVRVLVDAQPRQKPEQRPVIEIADGLKFQAKYIGRLFLLSLAMAPEYCERLCDIYPVTAKRSIGLRRMLKEIHEGLNKARLQAEKEFERSEKTGDPEKDKERLRDMVMERQTEFLRIYSYVGLVRLGHIYLRDFVGVARASWEAPDFHERVFENSRKNMKVIHDEMGALSDALLWGAYWIARRYADVRYGRNYGFAVVCGGANARIDDFPSFDYDVIPLGRNASNRDYYGCLAATMENIVRMIGHDFDPSISLTRRDVKLVEEHIRMLKEAARGEGEKRVWIRAYTSLRYAVGDHKTAQEFISGVNETLLTPAVIEDIIALRLYGRYYRMKVDEWGEEDSERNIKMREGGLRDVNEVFWLFRLWLNQQTFKHGGGIAMGVEEGRDTREVIEMMVENRLITREEANQLLESYDFLMDLRIRMDLHFGRNNKELPAGDELRDFAFSLGYNDTENSRAEDRFDENLRYHAGRVRKITEKAVSAMFRDRIKPYVEQGAELHGTRIGVNDFGGAVWDAIDPAMREIIQGYIRTIRNRNPNFMGDNRGDEGQARIREAEIKGRIGEMRRREAEEARKRGEWIYPHNGD
ncbi:MAG: hypothetical protein QXP42_04705 [Candidatus Micrarchaeia archaeon]